MSAHPSKVVIKSMLGITFQQLTIRIVGNRLRGRAAYMQIASGISVIRIFDIKNQAVEDKIVSPTAFKSQNFRVNLVDDFYNL